MKIAYIAPAFLLSLVVTVIVEEGAIAALGPRHLNEKKHFFPAVIKANLFAFLVASAIGAGVMIPKRMGRPGFLVMIYDFMVSA